MESNRKIIHIDMDAFYASVEQRDRPELRGRPVIVGGDPHGRGVVAACSYEARRFGIHSAMPASRAFRRCPQAVFLPPRFEVYRLVSSQIMQIFHDYTDLVEPLSLDEAFLDVTANTCNHPSATHLARAIKEAIRRRTGLNASAGVSFNKFLAKVASDLQKPDGLTVIRPHEAVRFIDTLPVGRFFGIGPKTQQRLQAQGIKTGADLRALSMGEIEALFGKAGRSFFHLCRGEDPRPVTPHHDRKSLGKELTFPMDIDDPHELGRILEGLALQIARELKRHTLKGRTVTLKLRYDDFTTITRSTTLSAPTCEAEVITSCVNTLLEKTEAGHRKVRLVGISISHLGDAPAPTSQARQLRLPIL